MLQHLNAFVQVYQTRSFTQASEILFISQPSVSSHIKQLETTLGVTLFERGKRQAVQPTSEADIFYQQAQQLLQQWHQTVQYFNQTDQIPTIKIGASHFSALTILPKVIANLATFPIQLDVHMHNSQHLIQKVLEGKMDFAFVEKSVRTPNLGSELITFDQLVLAGTGDTWLIREKGASGHEQTQRYFAQNGLPKQVITIRQTDIILALLKAGFGRAIVSQHLLDSSIPFQTLDTSFQRPVNLIWRTPLTDIQQQLQEHIKKTVI